MSESDHNEMVVPDAIKKKDFELSKRVRKEQRRIKNLLKAAGVPEHHIKLREAMIGNVAWMKIKLDDAREAIRSSELIVEYDNGGGQKGIRENPFLKSYENLWRSYVNGMKIIFEALPESAADIKAKESEKPKTMLELVRNKHKKEA